MAKKKYIESETIDGISITYELEEGKKFAVGSCPYCGRTEESIEHGVPAGPITASKLKGHMKNCSLKPK